MKKLYYSDLANIPPTVCPSSLDENLEPVDPSNTGHRWNTETDSDDCPITCSECGTQKDETVHVDGHHPKCAELTGGENGGHCNCEDGKILA